MLVTVARCGHAPRDPGAKMVVSADADMGHDRRRQPRGDRARAARELLEQGRRLARARNHAAQRQGACAARPAVLRRRGDLLLEPLAVVPAVAIFGMGTSGSSSRGSCPGTTSSCTSSTRGRLSSTGAAALLDGAVARVHVHHSPLPELVLGRCRAGTHVLILTHDHAEDFALCDAALRCGHLGPIGLIGSAVKWRTVPQARRRGALA